TIFTLVNAVLLNPLPVKDGSRIVSVFTTDQRAGVFAGVTRISPPNFLDYRDKNTVFSGMTAEGFTPISVSSGDEPEQVFGPLVTGHYFDVLGVRMAVGRGLRPDDDGQPGASPVVVMSYGLWQRRFGGRTDLPCRAHTLHGAHFTVCGGTREG